MSTTRVRSLAQPTQPGRVALAQPLVCVACLNPFLWGVGLSYRFVRRVVIVRCKETILKPIRSYLTQGALLAVCVALGSPMPSHAAGGTLFSLIDVYYHPDYFPGVPEAEVVLARAQARDSTLLRGIEGRTYDTVFGPTSIYVSALAQVDFGINRAESHLQLVDGHRSYFGNTAYADWQDTWTVACGSPSCPVYGFVTLGITLHGTASGSEFAYAGYELSANDSRLNLDYDQRDAVPVFNLSRRYYDTDGVFHNEYGPVTGGGNLSDTFYLQVRFKYDKPFDVGAWLGSEVNLAHYDLDTFSGWGSVMFGTTAALTSVDLPPGALLATASGATYPVDYAPPIPEPGTVAMLLAGLAALRVHRHGVRRHRGAAGP